MRRLFWALPLLLTACASSVPLGGGRYLTTEATQNPVMWGVSSSVAVTKDCKGTQREGYHYEKLDWSDCNLVRMDTGFAPGYGTAFVNAIIQGLTLGLVANFIGGDGGASASASATSSATAGGKGH